MSNLQSQTINKSKWILIFYTLTLNRYAAYVGVINYICIYIRMQGTYYRYHEVKMLLNYFRKKHLLKITTLLPCACARGKIEEEPEKITDHTHSQAVIFDLSRVRALHNLTLRRSEPN